MRILVLFFAIVLAAFASSVHAFSYLPENFNYQVSDYEAAANAGEPEALYRVGYALIYGSNGAAKDTKSGIKLLEKSAKQGFKPAKSELAYYYTFYSDKPNVKKIRRLAEEAGGTNDGQVAYVLYYLTVNGIGSEADPELAAKYLMNSALCKFPTGMVEFAKCLDYDGPYMGMEIEYDPFAAVNWLRKAADYGVTDAFIELYYKFTAGVKIGVNRPLAHRYLREGARLGDRECQYTLGVNLMEGIEGFEKDTVEGRKYLEMASAQGDELAADYLRGIDGDGSRYEDDRMIGSLPEVDSDLFTEIRIVDESNEAPVVNQPDVFPEFPGGISALMGFLCQEIRYPDRCVNEKIQGKVVARFVVKSDGTIGTIEILRSVDSDLDLEAARVIGLLPKFTPGTVDGKPVDVWYILPISFKLP